MARTVYQRNGDITGPVMDITVNDLPPHIRHLPSDERLPYRLEGKAYSSNTGQVNTTWTRAYATYGEALLGRNDWMKKYGADYCSHRDA